MVSPQLNEHLILAALELPVKPETGEHLRAGSVYAMLDAHDRKVTRDFYYSVLLASYNLNEQMRRAEVMARVVTDMDADMPEAWRNVLTERIATACTQAEQARDKLRGLMAKIMECPMDDSIIN